MIEQIGDADTLEAQSKAILLEADINDEEFSDDVCYQTCVMMTHSKRKKTSLGNQMFTVGE